MDVDEYGIVPFKFDGEAIECYAITVNGEIPLIGDIDGTSCPAYWSESKQELQERISQW